MQTVSSAFEEAATDRARKPIGRLFVAWDKTYDGGIEFFTIGSSLIGGSDVIKGTGDVIAESDRYEYTDESDSLMMIEYEREALEPVQSVTRAMADIILDNNDDRFTPGVDATIGDYIIPRRPMRIHLGFDINTVPELIQVFVGQNPEFPEIDQNQKTVRFHCLDFFDSLWNYSIQNTEMFVDQRSDEIIETLLQSVGLVTGQYELDLGINIIPFAYFEKGAKLGQAINKLAEAELGRFYLDENGIYRFENRQNRAGESPVWVLEEDAVIRQEKPLINNLVNVVEVTASPREVKANQLIWQTSILKPIAPGETIEFFTNYEDPVFVVDLPEDIDSTVAVPIGTTSYYSANSLSDGSGSNLTGDISLDDWDDFSLSSRAIFTNNGAITAYLKLVVWGQPAKKISEIFVRVTDQDSIDTYNEQVVSIQNDFIQTAEFANTIATILIEDRKDANDYQILTVLGYPPFQIGDVVTWQEADYAIIGIKGRLSANSGLTQDLTLVSRTIQSYFTIGVSTIGGTDKIAP